MEDSKKQFCKLCRILKNSFSTKSCDFRVLRNCIKSFQSLFQNKGCSPLSHCCILTARLTETTDQTLELKPN